MKSNNITVISRLETSDLTKYYRNATQFVARVVADDGSYVGKGVEVLSIFTVFSIPDTSMLQVILF